MHGVQVVNQRLHCLIGGLASFLIRVLAGKLHALCNRLFVERLGKYLRHRFIIAVTACQTSPLAGLLLDTLGQRTRIDLVVVVLAEHLKGLGEIVAEQLAEGLAHARRHRVIEVRHALTAVLVVLVGLDGDAAQGGVGGDVVGLPQGAVAGGEAPLEQLFDVDLAAGGGQAQEIKGEGDAQANAVYAEAFNRNPEFAKFYRNIEAYKQSFGKSTDMIVLDGSGEFFDYLKNSKGE